MSHIQEILADKILSLQSRVEELESKSRVLSQRVNRIEAELNRTHTARREPTT